MSTCPPIATLLTGGTIAGALTVTGAVTAQSTVGVTGLVTESGGTDTAGSAPTLTPSFSNGVAAQLSDLTRDYMLYLTCTTGGTATTVAIGPTSSPTHAVLGSSSVVAGQVVSFRLPAGWWVEWGGVTTAFVDQLAVGC